MSAFPQVDLTHTSAHSWFIITCCRAAVKFDTDSTCTEDTAGQLVNYLRAGRRFDGLGVSATVLHGRGGGCGGRHRGEVFKVFSLD